ncbi:MAG TPA: DUF4910 domain-containing protein [Coxiellaceae bacterium]|nr:DUF4910 domain-containing protein [Coxiellaceae bacterium]
MTIGHDIYQFVKELYPICRSLTGEGVRETLKRIQHHIPTLKIHNIPSGTRVFDWTVPDEWNIKEAYILDKASGEKIVDFKENNLHIVSYSIPIEQEMTFEELDAHLYSLPDKPNAIPYITSYYKKWWGFCITAEQHNELKKDPKKKYSVRINSTLRPGHLNYGELIISGETKNEILLSTYICHPSMANNELSGPCVTTALAQWIQNELKNRHFTYRILFLVETIGSIAYLSQHRNELKKQVSAGFVITCVGDNNAYSYVASRYGNTLADKVAKHILNHHYPHYKSYSFLERGSDERQYCSPGIDLPVCSICRSKYKEYPEYHTSLDNLSFVSPEGLQGGFDVYQKIIILLEHNKYYECTTYCEPQLSRRELYPTLSAIKPNRKQVWDIMNVIAYADGQNDLIDIAEKIQVDAITLLPIVDQLIYHGILRERKSLKIKQAAE